MRIAVDIGPLRPPFTGVGNFELFLLDALLAKDTSLVVQGLERLSWRTVDRQYLRGAAARAHKLLEGEAASLPDLGRPQAPANARLGAPVPPLRRLWRLVAPLAPVQWSARAAQRMRYRRGLRHCRLFHAFNYLPPAQSDIPVIPVVYDLSFIRYPDAHPPERLRALEPLGRELAGAAMVQTISQFSASEITEVFGIDRSRIVVTYPGVAPVFRAPAPAPQETLRRYGLTGAAYALAVGALEPRKNLRTVVAAYSRLPAAERLRMPLCIVGPPGWGDIALPAQSRALRDEGSLRFLGFVSDAELRDFYAEARVLLYPSLYEGFGMPVIEAMAMGTPVVVSASSSLPEAAGMLGRLVEPLDVDAWTDELRRAVHVEDASDSEAAIKRRAHALLFSWQAAAEETVRMYGRIAGTAE